MEQSKTLAVSVSAKEFVTYQCSQCGHCCRRIEGCVMVESLDAYRMAKYNGPVISDHRSKKYREHGKIQ